MSMALSGTGRYRFCPTRNFLALVLRLKETAIFIILKESTSAKYRNSEGLSVCPNELKAAQSVTMTVDSTQGCLPRGFFLKPFFF